MIASALAALMLAAAPEAGHAHADHAAQPPAAPAAAKPKTKRVCQTVDTSNSRMPKKVCTTVKVDDPPASAPAPAQAEVTRSE